MIDPLAPNILAEFDALSLECDGLSLVLHEHLSRYHVPHDLVSGRLERLDGKGLTEWNLWGLRVPAGKTVYHVWNRLSENRFLDLRARIWFGEDAPHGVFAPNDYPNFHYKLVARISDTRF